MTVLNNANNIGELAFIQWKNVNTEEIIEVASSAVDPIKTEPFYYATRQKPSYGLPDPQDDWAFHASYTTDRYNTLTGLLENNTIWKSNDGTEIFMKFPNGRFVQLDSINHLWTSKPNGRISMVHTVYTIVDDDLTENAGHDWDTENLQESNRP